jgi:restriction endonuclease S subunit
MSHPKEEYLFMEKVPEKWTIETFSDLFSEPLSNGIYKTEEFHGSGIKIINMGELFNFEFISNQNMNLIELSENEKKRFCVKNGDLLFARRSLVLEGSGKCSIVVNPQEEIVFESSIIRVRLDTKKANPLFYYYLFRSPLGRGILLSIATQTAVSGIRGSDLARLKIPYPPLIEQNNFVEILYQYDKLITNNNKKIDSLLSFGEKLFSKMFLDKSMRFDRFKNQNHFKLITKNIGPFEGEKEYYETSNVAGIAITKSNIFYTYEDKPSRAQKEPVNNSVWFARMKETKKILCFNDVNKNLYKNLVFSSGFIGLKTDENKLAYLFFLVYSQAFNLMKDAYATGATQVSLNNNSLKLMKIISPSEEEILLFNSIASKNLNCIMLLQESNALLFDIQTNLISLLFSDKNQVSILDKLPEVKL